MCCSGSNIPAARGYTKRQFPKVPIRSYRFPFVPTCSHRHTETGTKALQKDRPSQYFEKRKKRRRAYALLKPYISRTKALSKTCQHHAKKSGGNHPQRHPAHHGLLLQNSLPHPASHPPVHRQAPRPDHHHRRLLHLHRPHPRKRTDASTGLGNLRFAIFVGEKSNLQVMHAKGKSR